jgi:hypothetical protein
MSRYHQNAEEIPTIGRELMPRNGLKTTISRLNKMLQTGEILVGYYDKIAQVLTTQSDVDHFYRQYASENFLNMYYYAVPQEKLKV